MSRKPTLALIGATGAVGTVMRDIISSREDLYGEIKLVASARSAGKILQVRGEDLVVQELTPEVFDGVDIAIFDVPDLSMAIAPRSAAIGTQTADTSSGTSKMAMSMPSNTSGASACTTTSSPRTLSSLPAERAEATRRISP